MMETTSPSPSRSQSTCATLLQELQKIWDEIGEGDNERDKMLLELEQECLDIYRRKVDYTRKHKADLYQALADGEAEIARLSAVLGERTSFSRPKGTLKEKLSSVNPILDGLRLKKQQRVQDISEIECHITRICAEIAGSDQFMDDAELLVNEDDLTIKMLAERKSHLEDLQNEKVLRLEKVQNLISSIHELSSVMSLDFRTILVEIHPSLVDSGHGQSKSISNDTLAKLTGVVNSLQQEKQRRLQKVQDLGSALIEMWNLLETSYDDQKKFEHVTCLISSSVKEVSRPGSLSQEFIERAGVEVEQLNIVKASKMKELILKRQTELEEIYRVVHMDADNDAQRELLISLIDSGNCDMSEMLSRMDDQIRQAQEAAQSRKDILDRVEKWRHTVEEENWLNGYEQDENRYSAGRGVHINLKRAEKARTLVSKIPSLVENLIARVKAWEVEKGMQFLYDKDSLSQQLEEYTKNRQLREDEKRRTREQKKVQEQLATEKEALFGSKSNVKKLQGSSNNNNTMVGTPARRVGTPNGRHGFSGSRDRRENVRAATVIPPNFVALAKDSHIPQG